MKPRSKIILLVAIFIIFLSTTGYISYKYIKEQKELNKIETINKNPTLEEVRNNNDLLRNRKVNIYLFYGDGCPHCEELLNYFESIKETYGKYFILYAFEVWYNQENGEIMDKFAEKYNGEVGKRSVPYYIIGEEVMSGYSSAMNEKIKQTIQNEYKERKKQDKYEDIFNLRHHFDVFSL